MSLPSEANVELLVGRKVLDVEGKKIGRIEEIRAVWQDGELRVSEYLVGRYGAAVRLTSATLLPRTLALLGLRSKQKHRGYVIPWTWMDLTDPAHPRCTHPLRDLPPAARPSRPTAEPTKNANGA